MKQIVFQNERTLFVRQLLSLHFSNEISAGAQQRNECAWGNLTSVLVVV